MKPLLANLGNLWAPNLSYFNEQYHRCCAGSDTFEKNISCSN